MYFRRLDEAGEQDLVQHGDDLSLVVPEEHVDKIRGSTLDLSGGGMVLQNPNSPSPKLPGAAAADLDLSDPIVAKVVEVLDTQINPQIAAHGGFAELVAIEVPIAYLRMGGGCQGCGMAAVTLSQGIEVALLDVGARDHRGRRRDRPRVGHEPVLRGRQEVVPRSGFALGATTRWRTGWRRPRRSARPPRRRPRCARSR